MKKQLPTDSIANELSGASVYFRPKQSAAPPLEVADVNGAKTEKSNDAPPDNQKIESAPKRPTSRHEDQTTQSSTHDTVIPRHHDTTTPPNDESMTQSTQSTIAATTVEQIRKAVKQLGKEAATHRFTLDEKRRLADLVYTYDRQGYRTSENEITRIAINWLLWEYQECGEQSVLATLLEALHR